jgi:outer membrane receptor protein involved in Fe transport
VTLDGVPQNDPFGNWVIWTSLTPESLEGVSIARGAGAGPYGAGALTGVVALDEKSAVAGGLAGEASASDLGARRVSLAGSDKVGGVQLFAAGAAEDGDHWIPVRANPGRGDADLTLEDWTASGKAVVDIGRAALAARIGGYREARGSGLVGSNSASKGLDGSLTLAAPPTAKDLGYRLQAWVRQSNLYNASASISADRNTATPANVEYKTPATGWGTNAAVRKAGDWGSLEGGFDIRGDSGQESEKSSFVNGVFTKGRVAGGASLIYGLYAEGAWRAGPWLLTGGARVDEWRNYNGHRIETTLATGAVTLNPVIANTSGAVPTGRAGLRRELGAVYVRAAAYAGFRVPSLNELYRPFRVGNNITEANENLKPEKLYGGEAAIGQDQGVFTWSATGFVNQLKDPITNVTQGYGPATFPRAGFVPAGGIFYMRENAGVINATGVEADARYQPVKALELRLSGAFTDAKVDGQAVDPQLTGKRPAQTPKVVITGGASWAATAKLSFNAELRYEGQRFEDDLNTLNLRAAAGVDARVSYRITRDFSVFLAAENLTNAAIETGQTADRVLSYDEPRVIRIGLRFRG